jgi:hypothetical protein
MLQIRNEFTLAFGLQLAKYVHGFREGAIYSRSRLKLKKHQFKIWQNGF